MNKGRFVSRSAGKVLLSLLLMLVLVLSSALPGMAVVAAAADDGTTTLITYCQDAEGKNYKVTASYAEETGIPADARLTASAVTEDDEAYETYVSQAADALGFDAAFALTMQLFDIALVSSEDPSVKYQPAEGTAVDMKVRLAEAVENEFGLVHIGEEEVETLETDVSGRNVSFEATGFSVYAFVNIFDTDGVITDSSRLNQGRVYISAVSGSGKTYYMASGTNNDGSRINRTAANSTEGAAPYFFEKYTYEVFNEHTNSWDTVVVPNEYYMYVLEDGLYKKYVKLTADTGAALVTEKTQATKFTVTPCGYDYPEYFYFTYSQGITTYYLALNGDDAGTGFAGVRTASGLCRLHLRQYVNPDSDVLGLDGKSFAIAYEKLYNEKYKRYTKAIALLNSAKSSSVLSSQEFDVKANPLGGGDDVFITSGSTTVPEYTFHSHGSNTYYITTTIGTATKYLRVAANSATLVDVPDANCEFRISEGVGANAGRMRIVSVGSNCALFFNNSGFTGQNTSAAASFLRVAKPSDILNNDDFVNYVAKKVTVSTVVVDPDTGEKDFAVKDGDQVIVYTRIWNEETKEYEFYAIDQDGTLKRVYDEGGTIRWAGAQVNTLLWNFTDYSSGSATPNHYYELQNAHSGMIIAPQYHTGQVLSTDTIGINLPGRRLDKYYSSILAWDDYRYDYAGLKPSQDKTKVVAVPMRQASDFYFAIMDMPVAGHFTEVETVDSTALGVTLKAIDFQGEKHEQGHATAGGGRDLTQTAVMGKSTEYPAGASDIFGLVSQNLADDGYPVATKTNKSLSELFGDATPVNHLFIKSTYDETGYFEYNCCQNYATLMADGDTPSTDFTVYNELGTADGNFNSSGHGFFLPFNNITPSMAYTKFHNMSDVLNQPLSTDDPRLNETLYAVPFNQVHYHFGLEMEASFIMSESGLDDWGHDIIFEFAGDDDMWLFVDGVLVLDLGGIHSAFVGKVNFRTGEVTCPIKTKTDGTLTTTNLRAIFKANYLLNNPDATDAEAEAYLDTVFEPNSSTFKDYTAHTMKMFYMERGASASNLHMRFNMTTSTEGQLLVDKTVTGTDKMSYTDTKYAYQVWYYDPVLDNRDQGGTNDGMCRVSLTTNQQGGEDQYTFNGAEYVNYKDTQVPVEYCENYHGYQDVFLLKPGEIMEVKFPQTGDTGGDQTLFYVRECYVDTELYDSVSVNNTELTADTDKPPEEELASFSTQLEQVGFKKYVRFKNHVDEDSLNSLYFTKKLFDDQGTPVHYPENPNKFPNSTGFRFRVYIGEGQDLDGLAYYCQDGYHVLDPNGQYCYYDHTSQSFLPSEWDSLSGLSEDELASLTFYTSPSGSVDKIPCDFTVEISGLLPDTKFEIVERDSDIPKGYNRSSTIGVDGYTRAGETNDGYFNVVDTGYDASTTDTMNYGTVRKNTVNHIVISNIRGWGLTVEKIWSDADFMDSHDNIYFAITIKIDETTTRTDGYPVRMMRTEVTPENTWAETSLYYFIPNLLFGADFEDYGVAELQVKEENIDSIDENGYVTFKDPNDPENFTILGELPLVNGGREHEGSETASGQTTFTYDVSYEPGEPTGPAANVRTDKVYNSRDGIRIVKVDGNGNPLANAKFTLKDANGNDIIKSTYTSGSNGLVTYLYPKEGEPYTLTETSAPTGYSSLISSVTLTFANGELTVNGGNGYVTVEQQDGSNMITVYIKNLETDIIAKKVDDTPEKQSVAGAHFTLYRQVLSSSGQPMHDYYPMVGYEDLISDENGVIPKIDETLPVGTYYLRETEAPEGYRKLDHDILFSFDHTGNITVLSEGDQSLLHVAVVNNIKTCTLELEDKRTFQSITLSPQTLIADFGLDIEYNVKTNNYVVPANTTYEYIGITEMANYDEYGSLKRPALIAPIEGKPNTYQGDYGTMTLAADGTAVYQIGNMQFKGEDTFCLVAHVTQISGEAADAYAYEKLSYLPATTIYYEDDFRSGVTFIDGEEGEGIHTGHDYGTWTIATDESPDVEKQVYQAADLAHNDSANIFGYDPAYTEFATYSNKTAHKVSVSTANAKNVKGKWPSAEIVFAGTGFDLVSVTAGDTGMFSVKVYPCDANGNQTSSTSVASRAVDTYYGYSYGRVYLTDDGSPTLTETNRPLYVPTADQIAAAESLIDTEGYSNRVLYTGGKYLTRDVTYYDPAGNVTETPYYLDEYGTVTSTVYYVNKNDPSDVTTTVPSGAEADYVRNYAYAYAESWVMNNDASAALYQIPVIKVSGLTYGTYKAVIEARFTTMYGHYQNDGTYNYYDLYVDAFRIYNPANVKNDGTLSSTVIQEAYSYSSEAFEKFTTLKNMVVGANTLGSAADPDGDRDMIDGVVVVDGNVPVNSDRIEEYVQFGPNHELYLAKGMSLVFQLWTSATPADVQVQMKKISDSDPTLRVTYVGTDNSVYSKDVEVRSSTDLSYSILKLLGKGKVTWTQKKKNNKTYYTSGTFIISNVGEDESVISVTNLKWTYTSKNGNLMTPDPNYGVAVTPKSVSGVQMAMSFAKKNMAVAQTAETPAAYADGAITVTVTTGSDVQSLVVRNEYGEQIDEALLDITYKDLDDGQRLWTVTVTETEDGDYTFLIAGESDGLESGEPITVTVSVDNPKQNETEQPEDPAGGDTPADDKPAVSGLKALLEQLKPLVQFFLKLLKTVLAFFGIKF